MVNVSDCLTKMRDNLFHCRHLVFNKIACTASPPHPGRIGGESVRQHIVHDVMHRDRSFMFSNRDITQRLDVHKSIVRQKN
jgi:hypothetical protein